MHGGCEGDTSHRRPRQQLLPGLVWRLQVRAGPSLLSAQPVTDSGPCSEIKQEAKGVCRLPRPSLSCPPCCVPAGTQPPGIAVLYLLSRVVTSSLQGLGKTAVPGPAHSGPQRTGGAGAAGAHWHASGSVAGCRVWGVIGWPGTVLSRTRATNVCGVDLFLRLY